MFKIITCGWQMGEELLFIVLSLLFFHFLTGCCIKEDRVGCRMVTQGFKSISDISYGYDWLLSVGHGSYKRKELQSKPMLQTYRHSHHTSISFVTVFIIIVWYLAFIHARLRGLYFIFLRLIYFYACNTALVYTLFLRWYRIIPKLTNKELLIQQR